MSGAPGEETLGKKPTIGAGSGAVQRQGEAADGGTIVTRGKACRNCLSASASVFVELHTTGCRRFRCDVSRSCGQRQGRKRWQVPNRPMAAF